MRPAHCRGRRGVQATKMLVQGPSGWIDLGVRRDLSVEYRACCSCLRKRAGRGSVVHCQVVSQTHGGVVRTHGGRGDSRRPRGTRAAACPPAVRVRGHPTGRGRMRAWHGGVAQAWGGGESPVDSAPCGEPRGERRRSCWRSAVERWGVTGGGAGRSRLPRRRRSAGRSIRRVTP